MGGKKEIYLDVRFFHRALQLALWCCTGEVQRLLVHPNEEVSRSVWLEFAIAVSPVDTEQWKTSNCICKLYALFKVSQPFVFLYITQQDDPFIRLWCKVVSSANVLLAAVALGQNLVATQWLLRGMKWMYGNGSEFIKRIKQKWKYKYFCSFEILPHDAMRKRGLCCRPVTVCVFVRHVGGLYPDN